MIFEQLGMASALETLCGQAYGAEQYQKVGVQTYTAIVSLTLVCLPLSLLWIYRGYTDVHGPRPCDLT